MKKFCSCNGNTMAISSNKITWKTKNEMKCDEVRMKNTGNEEDFKCHRELIMKVTVYLVTLKKLLSTTKKEWTRWGWMKYENDNEWKRQGKV